MRTLLLLACGLTWCASGPAQERPQQNDTKVAAVSTQTIHNYRKVDDQIITGGQPKEEHLQAAAAEGFKHVINLATINPRYSLADEEGLVRSLGMTYHHIPVDWGQPTDADFEAFEGVMNVVDGDKTLIHCAANFRVTAFYSLYAMKRLGWSQAKAEEFRSSIWRGSDHPVWEEFIRRQEAGNPSSAPK
ncbi:MAG: protein tyrosine phosphatase family protein [Steroidobacter sp.]